MGREEQIITERKRKISELKENGINPYPHSFERKDTCIEALNSGEIVVTNLPSAGESSEAFVGAAVAISYQVHVNVKFPGKYAEAELNVVGANKEEEVVFVMPIFSRGEHDLVSVKANFDVYNQFNEKIDGFESSEISINSGQRKELVHRWKADVPIGKYLVKAMLVYDGETINLESFFNVGDQELELHSIDVRNFKLGEIAKFEQIIENKWSGEISDVFTQMNIYDSQGRLISEVKSASYDFEPFSKKAILSYWDSAGVKEGNYRADFFLKYYERSLQKSLDLDVSKNEIKISGLTGYAISEDDTSEGGDLVFILLVVIGILIGVNIFWFFFFRKRLKK